MDAAKPTPPRTDGPDPKQPQPGNAESTPSALQVVLNRARAGDYAVLPELKQVLDEDPSIWQRCYQLVSMTEQAWLDKIAEKNLLLSQSIRRHVEQLKRDLAGPSPSPLEQLLAERIVVCWLGVQHAELAESAGDAGGGPVAQMRLRRLDAATRRFLAATKALAVTRRLMAGLKIEIRHTHGPTADAPVDLPRADPESASIPVPGGRPVFPPDGNTNADLVADRLRGLIKQTVGTETALASGVGV